MNQDGERNGKEVEQPDRSGREGVSRREFLKIAGLAGAAVGASAGLGGVLAACGGEEETTTTGMEETTTTGMEETTTTGMEGTTTVSSEAEMGRELKWGFVTPQTGGLAGFGTADGWCVGLWEEYVADGLVCGDGLMHPVTIEVRDTQSDNNRAGQVAGDLINNAKVDILMAASTTDTTGPAGNQGEEFGCPTILTDSPADSWVGFRGGTADTKWKWTYFCNWGNAALVDVSVASFDDIPTNKVVGGVWPNNVEGNDRREFYGAELNKQGYTVIDPGAFDPSAEDYTEVISVWKKEGCEILTGLMFPPQWEACLSQMNQQGYVPKICDIGIPTLFPVTMEALGEKGIGMSGPSWWHPTYPYMSSLTGETCSDLALRYEEETNEQWTQPIEHYMLGEWAVDVFKRTTNVDDKEEIIANVATTKMDTITGPIDFNTPVTEFGAAVGQGAAVVGTRIFENVVMLPMWMGQWLQGTTQNPWSIKVWPLDLLIVNTVDAPDIEAQAQLVPMPSTTFS
jgi:branched-chain amino acid transport system substrate-binding protein